MTYRTVQVLWVALVSLGLCGPAGAQDKAEAGNGKAAAKQTAKQPAKQSVKSPAKRAARPPANQTAAEAGKAYAEAMREDAPAAIEAYWDLDALLAGVFGDDLKQHSDAERARMKKMMLDFWKKQYGDPALAKFLATAQFSEFSEAEGEEGTQYVGFDTRYENGRGSAQSLHMKKVGGRWKVINQATNGRWNTTMMQSQYQSKQGKATPMEVLKEMVETAEARLRPAPKKEAPKKPESKQEDVPF